MRRLFWTFAPGVAGAGLLLMRMVAAAALASYAISGLPAALAIRSAPMIVLQLGAGLLLLVGFWTPIAGLLVVALEIWHVLSQPQDPWPDILLATLAGALTLLGPGAWSVDARLFGWKRINIRDRPARPDRSAEPHAHPF